MKQLDTHPEILEEKYLQNLKNILDAIKRGAGTSFDIFAELVSSTVWKSPKGLAETWIERVAPTDWKELQETSRDSIEERKIKHYTRTQVIKASAQLVYFLAKSPNLLQRMTTRLMVRDTLTLQLETNDQDRLIATELGLPHRKWKQLLGAISHIELPKDIATLSTPPIVMLDERGDFSCDIIFDGHVEFSEKQLPGVEMNHGVGEGIFGIGPIIALMQEPISVFTINDSVMSRFDSIIWQTGQEGKIRTMVLKELGGLPAWKKITFGGNRPEREKENSLSPVWKPTT